MERKRKVMIWIVAVVTVVAIVVAIFVRPLLRRKPVTLQGAVIQQDTDTNKELPIANVMVTAAAGQPIAVSKSNSTGFFSLDLPIGMRRGDAITLMFRHADYKPLDMQEFVGDKVYIIHLVPAHPPRRATASHPDIIIANPRVRYSIKSTSEVNVGSAVRAFQVLNQANVLCNERGPCSPDGKWKAAENSVTLDAGDNNEFRNARASCIAGPCPFTRLEADGLAKGGRTVNVSALNWSDTTTFLLEAEVFRTMTSDVVRESYPVIFGLALNFTLPASADGISIEADVNGEQIVFPLGPALLLSWADCNARVNEDQTRVYRCELKPGYRFR